MKWAMVYGEGHDQGQKSTCAESPTNSALEPSAVTCSGMQLPLVPAHIPNGLPADSLGAAQCACRLRSLDI